MKKILYNCRKSITLVLKLLLYMALMGIFFGFMSINNPQILVMSRTAAVTAVTFVVFGLLLMNIYGRYDIGQRKSKPIIYSLTLSAVFTDIITFLMLLIMNTNEANNHEYLGKDLLLLLPAVILQALAIILFTYGGHGIYFSFTDPEKCLVITDGGESLGDLRRGIGKYKKQYRVAKTISFQDSLILDEIRLVDTVFLHNVPDHMKTEIVGFCYQNMKNVYYTPEIVDIVNLHSHLALLDDVSVVAAQVKDLSIEQRLVKRLMDIVISLAGLLVLSPVLLACALAVKLGDKGGVMFKQNRVTKGGRIFTIYKFRTMVEDADQHLVTDHDSRITKAGGFLRKYRLDELPQLFNILKGDMSLVGPRPEMTEYVYVYSEALPEFLYRHRVKAGLTGYAQIMGKYNTSSKDKLVMDLMYIENFSLWNDVRIIFQTILVILRASESTEAFDEKEEARRRGDTNE